MKNIRFFIWKLSVFVGKIFNILVMIVVIFVVFLCSGFRSPLNPLPCFIIAYFYSMCFTVMFHMFVISWLMKMLNAYWLETPRERIISTSAKRLQNLINIVWKCRLRKDDGQQELVLINRLYYLFLWAGPCLTECVSSIFLLYVLYKLLYLM